VGGLEAASRQDAELEDRPIPIKVSPTAADRAFRLVTTAAALVSLGIVVVTLVFLVEQARPALKSSGLGHFLTSSNWETASGKFGVLGVLLGTIIIAGIAVLVASPLAVGMAIFVNEYAPRRLRKPVTSIIDLLAALPSLLFGMWGFFTFKSRLLPVGTWLNRHLAIIPFFRLSSNESIVGNSSFVAGMIVALMILPIITAVSREVMAQVPREQCEGALALGGTRWGMVRDVVLPFGRSGIVGGIILGLGRALGETIAVAFVITLSYKANPHILSAGAGSIAAMIATTFNTGGAIGQSGLVAAGLVLFLVTLAVNLGARVVVARAERH
jgi:phosphate transport system permease protein